MRVRAVCVAGILLLSLAFVDAADKGELDPANFPGEKKEDVQAIAAVYQKYPDEADILYQVAALHARAGHSQQALETLTRMMKVGAGLDPRPRDFGALVDDKMFKSIKATIRAKNPPVLQTRLAYQLDEGDLMPEGIAYSEKTHKLYMGSVKRKIVSLSGGGQYQEFVPPAKGGLANVIGLRVDDSRGELWAVSNAIGERKPDMVLGLFRFSLNDGKLIKAYPIDSADKEMLNDIAVTKDGAVYATASASGALWKVDPSGKVEKFLPDKSLPDPNGIFATPDGKYLLVAGWYGITRVDLRKRQTELLTKPKNVADGCLDGMYLYHEKIIGVQNCNHDSGRIMEFEMKVDYQVISAARTLASYDPMFDGITTAAIVGDQLYFVGNTQMRKKPGEVFDPLKILRLSLK